MLGEWGYNKKNYYIDTEKLTFEVGGKGGQTVLNVQVTNASLDVLWQDPAWQQWAELISDPGFKALLETATLRLTKDAKGEGKGKKGGAADRH